MTSGGAAGCTTHIYYILHEINHFSLKAWHPANSLCVCCLIFSHKLFFAVIQVHSSSVGMVVKEWSLNISSADCLGGRSSKCFDLVLVSWCSKYIIGYHGDQSEVNMAALVVILFCHLKEGGSIKMVIRVRGAPFFTSQSPDVSHSTLRSLHATVNNTKQVTALMRRRGCSQYRHDEASAEDPALLSKNPTINSVASLANLNNLTGEGSGVETKHIPVVPQC